MKTQLFSTLKEFCLTPAPSGFEQEMARKYRERVAPFCDRMESDCLGNTVGVILGKQPQLKPILLTAHMDRVGFIVSNIEPNGFLRLRPIGSPNEKALAGHILLVRKKGGEDWVPVACGIKSVHFLKPQERADAAGLGDILLDPGTGSAQETRAMGIEIGSPAVLKPSFLQLHGDRVAATALDNCGCLAAMVSVAEQLHENPPTRTVYLAATVWEEYNQRATAPLVRRYQPIAVISMDMLLAGDTPDLAGEFQAALGQGVVASLFNFSNNNQTGCIAHEGLYALTEQVAATQGLSLQRYVCGGCGDNAYAQLEADAPAAMEIGAAVRYAHSPCEVADMKDLKELVLVVSDLVLRIDDDFCQARF